MTDHLKLHLTEGPRNRRVAISDTHSPGAQEIHLTSEDLTEYLQAKQIVDKWQERFRHQRRYGWSY